MPVAAHEVRIVMFTERTDEKRDHLDQAGLLLQAAESQIEAGGNTSGHVKFTLRKEMMPDRFNSEGRMEFLERWRLRARRRLPGVEDAGIGGDSPARIAKRMGWTSEIT